MSTGTKTGEGSTDAELDGSITTLTDEIEVDQMVLVEDTDAYTTLVSYNYTSIATSEEYFDEARLAGEVLVQAGVIPVL